MKYTYEVIETETPSGIIETILRSDGAFIPKDEANSDYQRYLNPQAEQSTPNLTV
jgi:hypothetical protein